jgi:cell wall-associated protease
MRTVCKFYKIWIVICFSIFITENLFAQLSLKNTNWSGISSGEKISIRFDSDTLSVKNTSGNKLIGIMSFSQMHDTLLVFNSLVNGCRNDTGVYHIFYQHSGQLLLLSKIKEPCSYRNGMFSNQLNYVPDKFSAPRDWLQLDAAADSIAGISLYKAYELLKGLPSKPVVVAVIDNGFDMEHEDLKNIFWTNIKEIPANQIDDDKNGYIDDVHGWSFRSNKGGIIIENEQSSVTQLYATWKNKFDNVDTNRLTQSEKKKLLIYNEAKKEYFEKREDKKDTTGLKYSYNANYNSDDFIGGTDSKNNNYGSPIIRSTPNLSHGTHVAGIIGARRDNGKGIDGIDDNVIIMPIIATTGGGDERDKDIANAIYYAVNNGAQVINMSFSKRFSPDKELVDKAIQYAEQKHVLIIHAAGNDGNNDDLTNYYPIATYENGKIASNFITVGWSRPLFNYRLAHPYSGYGKNSVDLFAPGSDIFSTVPGDSYDYKSGSSMSTPCVSGVAALLLSYFPSLSTEQVKNIILRSVYKPDIMVNKPGTKIMVPFSSLSASGGIVNAYNAVKMALAITKKK